MITATKMQAHACTYRWVVEVRLADDVLHVVNVHLVTGVDQLHRRADGTHGASDGLHIHHAHVLHVTFLWPTLTAITVHNIIVQRTQLILLLDNYHIYAKQTLPLKQFFNYHKQ